MVIDGELVAWRARPIAVKPGEIGLVNQVAVRDYPRR
jgi:hypothetical protein